MYISLQKVYVTSELVSKRSWVCKIAWLTTFQIFVAGCIIVATARNIAVVIAMRCVQAFG